MPICEKSISYYQSDVDTVDNVDLCLKGKLFDDKKTRQSSSKVDYNQGNEQTREIRYTFNKHHRFLVRDNLLGERMFSDKLNSIVNRVDLFSDIISNLEGKFVFNSHDQFHDVERVQLEVIYEVSGGSNLKSQESSPETMSTLLASTASNPLTTSSIREVTSSLGKKV